MRKFRIELGLEPSRKKVTFSDEVTVKTVPKWIGVTGVSHTFELLLGWMLTCSFQPKSEHVHPDMSHLIGELAGWRSTEDPYSPIILLGGTFKRDYDHSDCPNPDCHYRLDDLYMGNNMEEWTIRSLSTISDNE